MSFVRLVRRILLFVAMLLLFTFGLDTLFRTPAFQETITGMVPWMPLSELDEITLFVLAGVAWLTPFFYLALSLVESRLSRGIGGLGSGGEKVVLTPEAIERAVAKQVKENVEQVLKVRGCEARQAGATVGIAIQVAVNDDLPVSEVQRRVREASVRALEQKIGITNDPKVSVKITDVISKPKKEEGRTRKRVAKPEEV